MLGSHCSTRPYEERCHSISIPERHAPYRPNSLVKLHYHVLTALPPNSRRFMSYREITEMLSSIWSTAVPGGDVSVQPVYHAAGAAAYAAKYFAGPGAIHLTGYCIN